MRGSGRAKEANRLPMFNTGMFARRSVKCGVARAPYWLQRYLPTVQIENKTPTAPHEGCGSACWQLLSNWSTSSGAGSLALVNETLDVLHNVAALIHRLSGVPIHEVREHELSPSPLDFWPVPRFFDKPVPARKKL